MDRMQRYERILGALVHDVGKFFQRSTPSKDSGDVRHDKNDSLVNDITSKVCGSKLTLKLNLDIAETFFAVIFTSNMSPL